MEDNIMEQIIRQLKFDSNEDNQVIYWFVHCFEELVVEKTLMCRKECFEWKLRLKYCSLRHS